MRNEDLPLWAAPLWLPCNCTASPDPSGYLQVATSCFGCAALCWVRSVFHLPVVRFPSGLLPWCPIRGVTGILLRLVSCPRSKYFCIGGSTTRRVIVVPRRVTFWTEIQCTPLLGVCPHCAASCWFHHSKLCAAGRTAPKRTPVKRFWTLPRVWTAWAPVPSQTSQCWGWRR